MYKILYKNRLVRQTKNPESQQCLPPPYNPQNFVPLLPPVIVMPPQYLFNPYDKYWKMSQQTYKIGYYLTGVSIDYTRIDTKKLFNKAFNNYVLLYPLATKILFLFVCNRLKIGVDRTLKLMLMFGLKKENLERKFILMEEKFRKIIDKKGVIKFKETTSKYFNKYIKQVFEYWGREIIRVFAKYNNIDLKRWKKPNGIIDLDKFILHFDQKQYPFNQENVYESVSNFNRLLRSKAIYVLNPNILK